jgi:nitrate/nitrite transporter NarK
VIMVALTLAAVGIYAAVSTFWSLPTAILTGTGAAAGLALVNSVGNLGGLAGPSIVGMIRQATGSFTAALLFLAAVVAFGGVIALLFGYAARARAKASSIVPQTANEPKSGQATRAGVGLRSASSFAAGLPFVSSAAPVAPGFSSPFAAAREMSTASDREVA